MKKSIYIIAIFIMLCALTVSTTIFVKNITHTAHMIPKSESEVDRSIQININTATVEELELLPSISNDLALRIITYRQENGPFSSVEHLMYVDGIGQITYESISPYLTVGG